MSYRLVHRLSEGVVVLTHPEYGHDLWDRAKSRRSAECQVTGRTIPKGSFSWRPITNGYNRMHRISDAGVAALEQKDQLS